MPWTGLVLDEFDRGRYRRFFGSGPVQSGKTLIFFLLPVLYHLFERRESVIIGCPKIDMAQAIYEERLRPAIMAGRYASQLPHSGAGSKGGRFLALRMRNGAILRFMGAGGGDEQRSSHTARVVVLTEIDKMDEAGASSRETDPVSQIEARTRAYGDRARIYAECTMSIPEGRIHREVVEWGTNSQVYLCCPHCGDWAAPRREGLVGWQSAEDVVEARLEASYACASCSVCWDEGDRAQALRAPAIVGDGQEILSDGTVEGDTKPTHTWGFRWNAMSSALLSMADLAEDEWRAERSDTDEDRRRVKQFVWAEPYEDPGLRQLSAVNVDMILRRKVSDVPRGVVPAGRSRLTVFIDLGLYRCWWTAWAWGDDAVGHCVDYGCIDVPQGHQAEPAAILTSLRSYRDETLVPGWVHEDGETAVPEIVLVDSGWQPDVAYTFVAESNKLLRHTARYMASKGMGTARGQRGWTDAQDKAKRGWFMSTAPGVRLVMIHSDAWKAKIHEGFEAPEGKGGELQIFRASALDHRLFARHIAAERREEEFVPGKGVKVYWNRLYKDNHWLDCTVGCRVAADMLGVERLSGRAAVRRRAGSEQGYGRRKSEGWKIGR